MKLSKREQTMLIIVAVVGVLALTYYYVVTPQIDKLADVSEQLITKSMEVSKVKAEIEGIPGLDEEINVIYGAIGERTEKFYPEILQKKLIVILDKTFADTGVASDSIGFSQITVKTADGSAVPESAPASAEAAAQAEGAAAISTVPVVESMSVTMPLKGTYEQIMRFIQEMENMDRVIIINSLQMAQGEEGSVSGGINIDFFALKKNMEQPRDEEYVDWPYNNPHGVYNPFKPYEPEVEDVYEAEILP